MSTEPDVVFIRNYFAGYELDTYCSDSANGPTYLGHNLEDCLCTLGCCFKFSLETRLLLRTAYQKLTPDGRVAFLAAHVRVSTSAGKTQYRLPMAENGLEKVCEMHFLNTLLCGTNDQVRQMLLGKQQSVPREDKRIKRCSRRVIDYNEDIKAYTAEGNRLEDFPIDINCVKVEETELDIEENEQLILPDVHPANNQRFTIEDSDEFGKSLNESIQFELFEQKDIKTEMNEQETDDDELMAFRADDSVEDTDNDRDRNEVLPKWKIENIKRRERKVRGLSYTSSSGQIIPARVVKPNCGATCMFQCRTRVSEELRQKLLSNLLLLSQSNQWKYINDHVCVMPVVNSRLLTSRRSFSYHYFLPVESRLVKVCKTMFVNTFDLTDRVFRRIHTKKIGDKHVVCGNPNFPALLKKGGSKFYFDYDERADQVVEVPQQIQCKCNLQCGTSFPEKVIGQIQSIYRRKSKKEQKVFLSKHVQLVPGRRVRYKKANKNARFYLPFGSTVKAVCRKMFQRTFNLNSAQIRSLLNYLAENTKFAVLGAEPGIKVDNLDEKILPDSGEESQSPSQVKHEPEDIKVELNESETDHDEFMVVCPREDVSFNEELFLNPTSEANVDIEDDAATDSQSEIHPSEEQELSCYNPRQIERNMQNRLRNRARTLRSDCGVRCFFQCRTRVSEEVRQGLLANLLQMSYSNQCTFIGEHICCMSVAKSRSQSSRRSLSCHYFLPVESQLVKVCKTMFINTYDLSDTRIRTILAKKRGDKHVVCGNPGFPSLLKKGGKFYYDYNEGRNHLPQVCKCEDSCTNKFPEELIEQIQRSFHQMSRKEQDEFFSKHVQLFNTKTTHEKNPIFRASYFLPYGSTEQEVCRSMFQHALKLNASHVRALVDKLPQLTDPLELAKEHIAGYPMEEDHYCAVSGGLRKLSHSPNLARMYCEYREEGYRRGAEPIEYRQYFDEFCRHFAKTGLLHLPSCPDCGYFDRG